MGLIGDVASLFGKSPAKDAAGTVAKANEAVATGVFNATDAAKTGVQGALDSANTGVNNATQQGNQTLQGLLDQNTNNLNPGIQSGVQGNTALQQYAASNPTFTAPTAAEVEQTPGYQFQLQQGANAITNQAAAQGLNSSGKALTDLTQYGQGLAGTYYQNAFNNAQSAFNTNQNATLNNLQALIGAGNTANTQNLQAGQSFGAPQAANDINSAQYLGGLNTTGQESIGQTGINGEIAGGNFFTNGANATAAGQLANGQGLAGLLGGLGQVAAIPGVGKALGLSSGATSGLSSLLGDL